MDYTDLDAVIAKWVAHFGSTLFTQWGGEAARFFYIPGDPPFECFQISVERANPGQVAVHARAVDTNDGTESELAASWGGTPAQLDGMLTSAAESIDRWKARQRILPDPPSPW